MSESLMLEDVPQMVYLKDYEAPVYLIDEIDLNIDLHDDVTFVSSHMRIRHNRLSKNPHKDLLLNGEELTLESIKLDGQPLPSSQYKITEHTLTIFNVPDQFELDIVVKIYPQKNTALQGLYRSRNTYCTQCEPEGFRHITYFMDRPDVLSRYITTISADKTKFPYLLSNGNPIAKGELENNRHWVKWEDPFNKPCYLFALVAGDFDLLEDQFITQSEREVTLRIYVEKGYGDQAAHAMYSLKEAMRWDEQAFGREYDLDIYMIVAISDFNMGAMENKGLNIFNTKYVLAKPETATDVDYIHILSVIGHEYFHNWSGNRVTCRDWFQLSLKEGLTIFRDQSFTEDLLSRAVMRIHDVTSLRETQFAEDASPLAHSVRPDSYIQINNFYTSTIYNKGAEVLRMLQTLLGKQLFRKGMDSYFSQHDGHAVTIEDFVEAMEAISGMDLTQFRLWYTQAGTPCLTAQDDYDAQQHIYRLTINQSCPATPGQPIKQPFLIPIKMGLLDQKGNAIPLHIKNEEIANEKILQLTAESQVFEFLDVPSRPIPSLLRHFSAPVKLTYDYADSDLPFLFKHDTDAFNRWEAGQKLSLRILLKLIQDYRSDCTLNLPSSLSEMFEYVLCHNQSDLYLLAEMLNLPSEHYIGEQMEIVDVDAIHVAREFVLGEIANQLQTVLLDNYHKHHVSGAYHFSIEAVGKRQLKNRCLGYLMLLPAYASLGQEQFEVSLKSNMTDTQAALAGFANLNVPYREKALTEFYSVWQQDALVVDKWLAIQASSKLPNTLQQVKKLMRHPAFDIKNPNKVYALIGSFGRNAVHFHARNGEGYAFLQEVVAQLDTLNPQVAARMVKPLTTWKRYDKERQKLMCEQLELLLHNKKLSKDVYELVYKSIES